MKNITIVFLHIFFLVIKGENLEKDYNTEQRKNTVMKKFLLEATYFRRTFLQ